MHLSRFELTKQRSASVDGVVYVAKDTRNGQTVKLFALTGVQDDAVALQSLTKRIRLIEMLDHPAVLAIQEVNLEHDPAFVVVEDPGTNSLAAVNLGVFAESPGDVLTIVQHLAEGLAAAHVLGLVHGGVCPSNVWMKDSTKLDFLPFGVGQPSQKLADTVDASCFPVGESGAAATAATDVYSLGAILYWLVSRTPVPAMSTPASQETLDLEFASEEFATYASELPSLIKEMLAADSDTRPTAKQVADRLSALRQTSADSALDQTNIYEPELQATQIAKPEAQEIPKQIGRFRVLDRLGEGGMGTVYRAEDVADGTIVAIKTLNPHIAGKPESRRRFFKEARLLAEVNNPYVTRLLEVNEDNGVMFLALEFVAGESVSDCLKRQGRFDETTGLSIMSDVARALVDAHHRGIVHRDVKPENILLMRPHDAPITETDDADETTSPGRAKLADFGLARQVNQSESLNVTQKGTVLGTPYYMAPEQCTGSADIDPRTDVYSMGATLFHILAGRPPFQATDAVKLIAMHLHDPPPSLKSLNPQVSEGVSTIVEKALAKDPDDRYQDADELLEDLERLLRGEPTSITVHPRLPELSDQQNFLAFNFTWDLESSPAKLWPYVCNTDRFNRAMGLPSATFRTEVDPVAGVRRFGETRIAGMTIRWEEHPFEWIEGKRFGVLREFSHGPFMWFISTTEMSERPMGGTTLVHSFRIQPRGLLGKLVTQMQMGRQTRKSLENVYRRIDRMVSGLSSASGLTDAFEQPHRLAASRRRRLEQRLGELVEAGVDNTIVEQLEQFLAEAADPEVARIRPIVLARRLGLDPKPLIDACLLAVRQGVLTLLWDILCPVCRVASDVKQTLRALQEHEHCEACNLDFDADFSESVELIFRVHPEIRPVSTGTYCIGGPAHFPHMVAQARIRPGERIQLSLSMQPGAYRIRSPHLPYTLDVRVESDGEIGRWELPLGGTPPETPPVFRPGRQTLIFTNQSSQELLVRVERTVARDDALTAAQASALARFRDLFPNEVMSPGQLANVAKVTLLAMSVGSLDSVYRKHGDSGTFAVVHECVRLIDDRVRTAGGAVVKIVGDGVLAAFDDPVAAVQIGLALSETLASSQTAGKLPVRAAIHRGDAMLTTINDRLDYFGMTVNTVFDVLQIAGSAELLLTQSVASDPGVAELLDSVHLSARIDATARAGLSDELIHRLTLPVGPTGDQIRNPKS